MISNFLQDKINSIKNGLGNVDSIIVRNLSLGEGITVNAVLLYINGLADKATINSGILNPLLLHLQEDLSKKQNLSEYLCEKYITVSFSFIHNDLSLVIKCVKRGKTVLIVDNDENFIVSDTTGGEFREIEEPEKEIAIRSSREGFVENLEINISMIRRRVRDKNLSIENFILGKRGQQDTALVYINDIADQALVEDIRNRLNSIDVDNVLSTGGIEQFIENHKLTLFPQSRGTERPDIVAANLLEGRIVIILEGSPYVIILPAMFLDFFQTVEDYYERTITGSFGRVLRLFSFFTVITLPSLYLCFIKFNADLLPIQFIEPIAQSRKGIALSPFMEIFTMLLVIELLREGGLRLPSKIGQTLSVVGGIIIGDAALKARFVSPATLLVVGIATVASFAFPNYEMSLAIRFMQFPMLLLSDVFGIFGNTVVWFIITVHLCSLDSFGIPYLNLTANDMNDSFIRNFLWKMNKRPDNIPHQDPVRQADSKGKPGGEI